MAFILADRVKQKTATTGTGSYTLSTTAVAQFNTAQSKIGTGNSSYFTVVGLDSTGAWAEEHGLYTLTGNTLARTAIYASSNGGSAVDWGVGNKTVFCTPPAARLLYLNATGTLDIPANVNYVAFAIAGGSAQADSGTALTITGTHCVARVRLTGNATLTLPTAPTLTGNERTVLEVELVQDATGSRTVTWAAQSGDSIVWDYSSVAPAISSGAGKETHFVFRRRAGSTVWRASKVWQEI